MTEQTQSSPWAAAIFDFDETLVNLEREHDRACVELCREKGCDYYVMPESFRNRSGYRVVDDVDEIRAFFGWPEPLEELYARRQQLFLDICDRAEIPLLPGARATIERLAGAGWPLAIASSGVKESIRRILARHRLDHYFKAIVGGEDVERGKPDPEPFLTASSQLGIGPEATIVFEDSAVGVAGAKRAAMTCVAVRNPRAHQPQDLSPADLVIDGFPELDVEALLRGELRRIG